MKSFYFGKVIVDFLDNELKEFFYIGIVNFIDDVDENFVYDWCLLIVEFFYNNVIGLFFYMVC